jgi:hypothetical protein
MPLTRPSNNSFAECLFDEGRCLAGLEGNEVEGLGAVTVVLCKS